MSQLFEYLVGPPKPKLSATSRLTQANNNKLASGVHPATGLRLKGSECCGDCSHHHRYEYHNGSYHKCDLHRLGQSHSAASDIRVSWPACTAFGVEP
jgi:hypothetical protein